MLEIFRLIIVKESMRTLPINTYAVVNPTIDVWYAEPFIARPVYVAAERIIWRKRVVHVDWYFAPPILMVRIA